MFKSRQPSEDFDPVSAEIYGPTRSTKESGVQTVGPPVLLFTTRIKCPRGLFVSERLAQQKPDSQADCIIEVSSMGLGASLTSDMSIIHRGVTYEIKGKLPGDYRTETVLYQCKTHNNPL